MHFSSSLLTQVLLTQTCFKFCFLSFCCLVIFLFLWRIKIHIKQLVCKTCLIFILYNEFISYDTALCMNIHNPLLFCHYSPMDWHCKHLGWGWRLYCGCYVNGLGWVTQTSHYSHDLIFLGRCLDWVTLLIDFL